MCADGEEMTPGLAPGQVWYREGPRESKIVLEVVAWNRYLPDALAVARFALGDEYEVLGAHFSYAERAAVAEAPDAVWVVYDEGVATRCEMGAGFALPVQAKVEGATVLADLSLDLTVDEVLACRTGEQINLANFIATGSRRHEENFDVLNARLSGRPR